VITRSDVGQWRMPEALITAKVNDRYTAVEALAPCVIEFSDDQEHWRPVDEDKLIFTRNTEPARVFFRDLHVPLSSPRWYRATAGDRQETVAAVHDVYWYAHWCEKRGLPL
jgi:hypothetical protein